MARREQATKLLSLEGQEVFSTPLSLAHQGTMQIRKIRRTNAVTKTAWGLGFILGTFFFSLRNLETRGYMDDRSKEDVRSL